MLYLITDTHLGHQNMLKSCGRPARFTNLILDSCRKMVRSNDMLIHLGDVAWNEKLYSPSSSTVNGSEAVSRSPVCTA